MNQEEFRPMVVQGISREDYNNAKWQGQPLERQSNAKYAAESRWHYYMHTMNPKRPTRTESDHMLFGTLAHEGAIEDKIRFASFPGTRRGKAWENFKLKCENEGLISITEETGTLNKRDLMGAIESAKEALEEFGADADEECGALFDFDGIKCKALLDKLSMNGTIFDLKFTDKIDKESFSYHAFDMGYDFQCVWYKRGLQQALSMRNEPQMIFITIQKKYPYEWNCHVLEGDSLSLAQKRVDRAIKNIKHGRETGDWSHEKRTPELIVAPFKVFVKENEYQGAVNE